MKTLNIMVLLAAAALIGIMSIGATEAQDVPAMPVSKVGVVKIAKVLRECQENLDREKRTVQRRSEVKMKLEEIAAEADALSRELEEALEPGSKQYTETLQNYFNKRALYEAYGKGQERAVEMESQAWLEDIYARLLAQVEAVGRREGMTLVMNYDDIPVQGHDLQDLYNMVLGRTVLYSSSSIDITAEVLEAMDAEYELLK